MERNQQYVFAEKVILRTELKPLIFFMQEAPNISTQEARASFYHDISSIEILRDMLQAWESYPTSHHSVKSLHEGL